MCILEARNLPQKFHPTSPIAILTQRQSLSWPSPSRGKPLSPASGDTGRQTPPTTCPVGARPNSGIPSPNPMSESHEELWNPHSHVPLQTSAMRTRGEADVWGTLRMAASGSVGCHAEFSPRSFPHSCVHVCTCTGLQKVHGKRTYKIFWCKKN